MMKWLFFLLVSTTLFAKGGGLPISYDYAKGMEAIETYKRPAILVFTSSDSPDSKQFGDQILNHPDFFTAMQNRFAFIVIDFPQLNMQSMEQIKMNTQLKEQFGIDAFPSLVMVDYDGKEISRLAYNGGTCENFAHKLSHLYTEYLSLSLVDSDYKEAYQRALALGSPHLIEQFMEAGLTAKENGYFLIEKYVDLATKGERASPEARKLRRKILKLGGEELENAKMRLALCDFQELHDSKPNVAVNKVYRLLENNKLNEQHSTQLSRLLANHFITEKDFQTAKRFAEKMTESKSLITQREGKAYLKVIEKSH